jgi:Spy/CpxP family protein refolding chaperone
MSIQPRRVAAIYLGAVFLAGLALGVVSYWFYAARTAQANTPRHKTAAEFRQRMAAELKEELELGSDQVEQVRMILDSVGQGFHDIRDEVEPKFEALRQERAEKVMSLLRPEQQAKYERILQERRERRKERHHVYWGAKNKPLN